MAIMMTNDIEWKMVKLGDVAKIIRGGSPRPIEDYITDSPNGINWIKIGDVAIGAKYIEHTEEKIIPAGMSKSRAVKAGDFLLSNSMSFGRPYILKVDGAIHDGWLAIQNYEKTFQIEYLYYVLSTDFVLNQYKSLAAGSSVLNLNKQIAAKVNIPLPYKNGAPDLETQKQIAQKLSDMESLIAAKEKLLAKKRNLKTAAMQKLIKNEEGENWKKVKLGELIDSANYGVGAEAVDYDGENKYLRITDIDDRTHEFIPNPLVSPSYFSERYLVKADDLLIARTGASVGKTYLYNEKDGKLIYAGFLMKLHIKKAISKFVFYQTLTENYNKFILSESARTGQPGVNLQQIKKFEINIPFNSDASPDLNEQRRIASILSDMDSEIAAIEKEITKLQNLKTAMMQKMFCFGDSDSSSE